MLPIRFGVTDVTTTRQVCNIQISIQEDYRHLVYVGKPQPHQVPISFVGMPETSSKNIQIKDLYEIPGGFSIMENSYTVRFLQRFTNKVFDLPSRSALMTDITVTDTTGEPEPLFYKHVLSSGFSASPEILDQDMNPVRPGTFKLIVQDSEIAVYHNFSPDIDPVSNRVRVHYIRYTTNAGIPVFTLLETTPAFKEGTLFDWPLNSKRLYTVRQLGSKFRYRILYNGVGPFYLKLTHDSQIKLKKPLLARSTEPWYLRITDGELVSTFDGTWEKYSIPEYHFQAFTPVEPIQYSGTQECKVITNNLVLAPFGHLLVDNQHRIEFLVTDDTLKPKHGYTSSQEEGRRFWVDRLGKWRAQGGIIKFPLSKFSDADISLNKTEGVIHLPVELLPTDRVFVRAYREVKDYTYMSLNLNPLHNRKLLKGRAVIYILPDSQLDESQIAVQHLVLDVDDNIVDWSDPRLGDEELIEELAEGEGTAFERFQADYNKVLILGVISISREASLNDLTFIDVREKGGGLAEDIEKNLPKFLEELPELQWISDDSVSGRSIPLLGSFTVDLPFSLLEEAGGHFTKADIEEIVKRHMSLGGFPVINYYADVPVIGKAYYNQSTSALTLSWTSVEHADKYRVYVSGEKNGGYGFTDVTPSADTFLPNSLTSAIPLIGGVAAPLIRFDPTTKIYAYVAPLKDGHEWPASEIVVMDLTQLNNSVNLLLSAQIASAPNFSFNLSADIIEE